jgi:very-short-patch-repair endonuclease
MAALTRVSGQQSRRLGLNTLGWRVVRVWEHEDPDGVVHRVVQALQLS